MDLDPSLIKEALKHWMIDSLQLIRDQIKSNNRFFIKTIPFVRVDETNNTPSFFNLMQIIDWEYHIFDYFRAIDVLPRLRDMPKTEFKKQITLLKREYGHWLDHLESDEINHLISFDKVDKSFQNDLLSLYCRLGGGSPRFLIENSPTPIPLSNLHIELFSWDEQRYIEAFNEIYHSITSKHPRFMLLSAIWGFPRLNDSKITLDDELVLRKPTYEEIIEFGLGPLTSGPKPVFLWFRSVPFVVEKRFQNRSELSSSEDFILPLQELLNLCGSTAKISNPIHFKSLGRYKSLIATSSANLRIPPQSRRWVGDVTSLKSLNNRYTIYKRMNKTVRFNRSLLWFSKSLSARSVEEKTIYLAIALESLLIRGHEELNFRLGLFMANLLRDLESQSVTSRNIKAFYSIRSSMLHEGIEDPWSTSRSRSIRDVRSNFSSFRIFLNKIEDYTRKCLRLYLGLEGSDDERITQIESLIFNQNGFNDPFID